MIISHMECEDHKIANHIEQPDRLKKSIEYLHKWNQKHTQANEIVVDNPDSKPDEQELEDTDGFDKGIIVQRDQIEWKEAPLAEKHHLEYCHTKPYIDEIFRTMKMSEEVGMDMPLDGDTSLSKQSRNAILRGAGSVIHAVDNIKKGPETKAFCLVRPPGHHAEANKAMGFCIFNNIFT
eukprot:UN26931